MPVMFISMSASLTMSQHLPGDIITERQRWDWIPASAGMTEDERRDWIPAPYRGTGHAFAGMTEDSPV